MIERLRFLINRLREKLWIRPLLAGLLSLLGAFLARGIEATALAAHLPSIQVESVETLLVTMSGSMLVIATFAVGSMVSSLASAGSNATPRTFPLVISDDMSQNALSIFIGAFIFSLVSIVFLKNDYYASAGLFALFVFTAITFAVVILTFVRWVDSIARLGRLGTTIDKAVAATERALRRRHASTLCCSRMTTECESSLAVTARNIGYVQRIDLKCLQDWAEQAAARIVLRAEPGTFAAPGRVLAHVLAEEGDHGTLDTARVENAFVIGDRRTFDEDPRFGLIVLSEIAGRALSPAVNDPGTAIDIIGALVRVFADWSSPADGDDSIRGQYDRIEIPELCARDLFDDAFTAIARDGAASVEVATRLQKALRSLASVGHPAMREAAMEHSRMAMDRAAKALTLPADIETVRALASFSCQE